MRNNTLKRVTSFFLAMAMILSISLPDLYDIYEVYAESSVSTESTDKFEQSENAAEPSVLPSETETIEFKCGSDDFSAKLRIDKNAEFSVENEQVNADDVVFSAAAIEESDERYKEICKSAAEDECSLLLYDIGFYTKDGKKIDVSKSDAYVTFYFNKPYAVSKSGGLSAVKCTKVPTETDETGAASYECSETEIIGSTNENNVLKDVTFHVDLSSVYGICIPENVTEKIFQEIEKNAKEIIREKADHLAENGSGDSSGLLQDISISINKFVLSLTNGAVNKNGQNIWTADKPDEGHGFTYELDFNSEGTGSIQPGVIEIRLPKHILKDKDGNYADTISLPYPSVKEDYDKERIVFVYSEEKGQDGKEYIVITNLKELDAAQQISIPFMYETTKKTWEYIDMESSDDCQATVIIKGTQTLSETEKIPVYINTSAEIKSTSKSLANTYTEWKDIWGAKPDDADEYIYFEWAVDTSVTNITQKYNFQLTDQFTGLIDPVVDGNASPEVIGYKMQGSSKYVEPDSDGASPVVSGLTANSRKDRVLTKCKKSYFKAFDLYRLENNVTATVTPADGKDSFSQKTASATGIYEIIKPADPTYSPPGERYRITKNGIYGNKQNVTSANNISSYNLEALQNGKPISGLTYHIVAQANAYIKTLEKGATGTEQDATDGKFGQQDVAYSVSDSEIFLGNSTEALTKDDYTFTSLEYSVKMLNAKYDKENKKFSTTNVKNFRENDILEFFVEKNGEYTLAGTYNLKTGAADIIDSDSISSITKSSVTFKGYVKGWKIKTSNPYYSVEFNVYPTITLNPTETVKEAIPKTDNAKISVKNRAVLIVTDSSDKSITRSAVGTDYAAKVQRNSNIQKKVTSSKNYPGNRAYKIDWETSMSETYTDDEGTNPVRQESGVFYDFIPSGCRVDLSSIKVFVDNEEIPLSEYTIEPLKENYKNSSRTLFTVKINRPANVNYKMTYTTVHLWEDILDYGRYVLNSVAYETGNPDIASGYPDNGGNISDSTILSDLDPESNDKRFLYAQATHSINALIPLSSGISKKVASSNDALFGDKTVVYSDSTYVYKIRMENASHSTSTNIVIFDSLENFNGGLNDSSKDKQCDWNGTLESFGLSNLEALGIKPVIYLSSVPKIDLSNMYTTDNAGSIEFDSEIWTPMNEFGDIAKATAFAIDLSSGVDGTPFELGENRSFSFTVTMRSPKELSDSDRINAETYNNIYRSFISKDTSPGEQGTEKKYYDHQDYTTVVYHIVGDMRFKKINSETKEPIQGVKFNLSGTSFYGTEVDEYVISDSYGVVYLANIERGTYTLTETDPTRDFLKGEDRTVTVGADGSVTITPNDGANPKDGEILIENKPRVHGDLTFLKRDYFNQNIPLSGAVFTLTGTSYYGNVIEKKVTSSGSGVTFEDVEWGEYTLKEVSAPDGYVKDSKEYKVVCDDGGILSIPELSLNSSGDYVITNKPCPKFTLRKVDAVNRDPLPGAEFKLTSVQTETGITINKTVTSAQFGQVVFDGLDYGTYTVVETTPPANHKTNTNGYEVKIELVNDETVVTVTDKDTGKELNLNLDGEFVVPNEREYKGEITIVKKWIDDGAERPEEAVIHLDTKEPEYEASTATINIQSLKENLPNSATSFSRYKYPLTEDQINGLTVIGTADDTTEYGKKYKQKPVYLYNEGTDYYYWSEAETVYLGDSSNNNASNLFTGKNSLTSIDISGLDTSKVTNFNDTFKGLAALTYINVGELELDSLNNAAGMFVGCKNLTTIEGTFGQAPNLKLINGMFQNCNNLTSVDLSKFTTSNVTDMKNMFSYCQALTYIDVSNFNTENVQYMNNMFGHCTNLQSIDLSSFDTSCVKDINRMFDSCTNITSITLGEKFTLENIIGGGDSSSAAFMFAACAQLKTIDISGFGRVQTDVRGMFKGCSSLKTIYVSSTVDFTDAVDGGRDDNRIFGNNLKELTGGSGTKWSDNPTIYGDRRNVKYAKIDGGPDDPGYFTLKPEAANSKSVKFFKAVTASLNNSVMLMAEGDDSPADDSAQTDNTVTESYVSTNGNQCTIEKKGDTWIYTFKVYDDEALYYVYEELVEGYISDATQNSPKKVNEDGSITKQQTVTNTKIGEPIPEVGSLKITKEVTKGGVKVTDDNTVFKFKITLTGSGISNDGTSQYFGAYEFNNGVAEISLTANKPITIPDIPVDTTYTIKEIEVPYGYTSAIDEKTGTIVKNTTSSVTWENKADNRETKDFHVFKTVEIYEITEKLNGEQTEAVLKDTLPEDEAKREFSFTATLTKLGRSKEYTIEKNGETLKTFSSDDSGNALVTFVLKHGETADFKGVPINSTYQITETHADGYTTSYTVNETTHESNTTEELAVSADEVTVAFKNSKTVTVEEPIEKMDITVEKQWKEDEKTDRPKSITVYLERYPKGFPNNAETVDTAIITPRDSNWTTVFKDLPKTDDQGREYEYSVREESVAGYNGSVGDPITDSVTGNKTFTITNTKILTYDLTISKTVEGAFGNKAKQFEFTVTLKDQDGKPLNGFYTLQRGDTETLVLFDAYGQAKIGVSHGENAVIKNLPEKTKFTVTETDYSKEGYTTKSGLTADAENDSQAVKDVVLTKDTTAYFVNSRSGILPTGVTVKVIPFVILGILSAGTVLFIMKKRRNDGNSE